MYLTISYKPASSYYSKGCHMADYVSDCIIREFETDSEVINHLSDLDAEKLSINEKDYEHIIYFMTLGSEEIFIDYQQATAVKILALNKLELEKSTEKLIRAREEAKQQDLKKLAELKAKYEN